MNTIVITGASEGIGAELARQYAHAARPGTHLVLAARNLARLQDVAQSCGAAGVQVHTVVTDVSVQSDCQRLVSEAVRLTGRLDTLINNAGMSAHALFDEVPADKLGWYEDLMRVNLWGSVWCTHAALPHLKASQGRLVAVSSLAGLVGVPGRSAYSATKFAMTGFFEALRAELRHTGVSVTTAYPGVVATEIRYRGYNAVGQAAGRSGLKEDRAMSVSTCARLIREGCERRDREVVMTAQGRLGRWLKLLAPGLVESMALKALHNDVKPGSP